MGDGLEGEPTRVLATGQEEACWGAQAEDDGERSRRAALQLQRGLCSPGPGWGSGGWCVTSGEFVSALNSLCLRFSCVKCR